MAQSRTDSSRWTNPEVRFERTDIEYQGVVIFSIVLAVTILLSIVSMFWYGDALLRVEASRKQTDLPPAAVDRDRLPPEPRLEALEDIRLNQVKLFPPRAAEYFAGQRALLEKGDSSRGIEPIEVTMAQMAKAAAKSAPNASETGTPNSFGLRLPSKAAAGRLSTGAW